ncbi:kinase-like domain-containing protein [Zopfochytrium polystomum]|nr:kinase-like domain-containing protein [Zopfochytrium polystomum]
MAARHSSQRLAVPDPRHVRQIFAQVAAAVYHLHAVLHTAHGDIKEENVLVQAARAEELCTSPEHRGSPPHAHTVLTAVLCDYGHAVRGDDDSRPPRLTSYGTAQVTPPELRRRPRRAGQRLSADGFAADVFALGVLLYTMLHGPGHVPRALDPAAAVTGDDGLWQPAWIPERGPLPLDADEVGAWVPRECVEIVRGMTMVRPEERWGMERVIAHPWVARG